MTNRSESLAQTDCTVKTKEAIRSGLWGTLLTAQRTGLNVRLQELKHLQLPVDIYRHLQTPVDITVRIRTEVTMKTSRISEAALLVLMLAWSSVSFTRDALVTSWHVKAEAWTRKHEAHRETQLLYILSQITELCSHGRASYQKHFIDPEGEVSEPVLKHLSSSSGAGEGRLHGPNLL